MKVEVEISVEDLNMIHEKCGSLQEMIDVQIDYLRVDPMTKEEEQKWLAQYVYKDIKSNP